jgi:6-phosphogluconolactonase
MSAIRIEVRDDALGAAQAAAQHVAAAAHVAIAARGSFLVAFSGGRTPGLMLAALLDHPIAWQQVQVFQVDERIAPAGDAARNLNALRGALLVPGALPERNLHAMPVEDADPAGAAQRYAFKLRDGAAAPLRLDLVHLGLGDDGHTASLVPGDAALHESVADVAVTGEYRGHRRMTLTFAALDRARERLWLATGADKADMLARLHAGDAAIPAGRVSAAGSVLYCDAAAATRLAR